MIRIFVGLLVVAALLVALGNNDEPETPAASPSPRRVDVDAINTQDRVTAAHRRRESLAFDTRPLLAALPIERSGVRIDIAGLGDDGRVVVLRVSEGARDRSFARAIYRRVLAEHRDRGTSYRIRWER